jgi:hypothetical protein
MACGIGTAFNKIRVERYLYCWEQMELQTGIIPFLKIYNETARPVDQCFTNESKVITNNGLINIDKINKGDLVLTSDGKFKKGIRKKRIYER